MNVSDDPHRHAARDLWSHITTRDERFGTFIDTMIEEEMRVIGPCSETDACWNVAAELFGRIIGRLGALAAPVTPANSQLDQQCEITRRGRPLAEWIYRRLAASPDRDIKAMNKRFLRELYCKDVGRRGVPVSQFLREHAWLTDPHVKRATLVRELRLWGRKHGMVRKRPGRPRK